MKYTKYISLIIVACAVLYNLWLYRLEPSSKVDPNDNPFQYALVDRTNQIWDFAAKTCHGNPLCFSGYLIDHWVPNWAQGYNLPFYYSHAPQIVIVGTYRFVQIFSPVFPHLSTMTLFQWYHFIIYLLLCLFPISVYLALRVIRLPYPVAAIGAAIASHISTDGLYGLDPSSFLWRGYGLTSQLFAMAWLPLAIAFGYRFLSAPQFQYQELFPDTFQWLIKKNKRFSTVRNFQQPLVSKQRKIFWLSVVFLVMTISGHLGIGVMTLLSLGIFAITPIMLGILVKQPFRTIVETSKQQLIRITVLSTTALFFLSYWIIPALLEDKYHNLSFWDPVWKFNSWGWREVLQHFFNGNLFDFGRFPALTLLVIVGAFAALYQKRNTHPNTPEEAVDNNPVSLQFPYAPFGLLFIFWLLMFFGRATWGGLLDIIPSMKEFHQSRFIVGVHLSGFFLIPLGFLWLAENVPIFIFRIKDLFTNGFSTLTKHVQYSPSSALLTTIYCLLSTSLIVLVYPQTYRYSAHNDVLIKQGNDNFDRQNADVETLMRDIRAGTPGRVFTGRGGSWGKKLLIAETTYFMHLSTFGIPVILWLPETWSPNSDVEQFFIEEKLEHYDLMNVRYVVTTKDVTPQPFWEFVKETPQWKLYTVKTSGYFGIGSLPAIIESNKLNYINLVRLWLQSDSPKQRLYPSLTFNRARMMSTPLPAFTMIDEATYQTRDGKRYGLFGDIPSYEAPEAKITLAPTETMTADMEFSTKVTVEDTCNQCLVFLKQSFHPNWHAWVDGKKTNTFITFPFYTAITLNEPGEHTIVYKYLPSPLKMILFTISGIIAVVISIPVQRISKRSRIVPASGKEKTSS